MKLVRCKKIISAVFWEKEILFRIVVRMLEE